MQPSRIHHVGLPVSDLDRSVAWYREALRLTHESTAGVPEGVAFMVAPTGERLELLAVDPTPPGRARGQLAGVSRRGGRDRGRTRAPRRRAYTPAEASPRPLRHEDVMIVAPYNLQVRCLRGRLPEAVRVGTVDKFQGQQAPVVFYSTASSSGAEIPRGLEFLLSRNRLNVAISRAQCLAYLVGSPRLLDVLCRTIEQMRMANALCRAAEMAEGRPASVRQA